MVQKQDVYQCGGRESRYTHPLRRYGASRGQVYGLCRKGVGQRSVIWFAKESRRPDGMARWGHNRKEPVYDYTVLGRQGIYRGIREAVPEIRGRYDLHGSADKKR